jgi:hypothetical protein
MGVCDERCCRRAPLSLAANFLRRSSLESGTSSKFFRSRGLQEVLWNQQLPSLHIFSLTNRGSHPQGGGYLLLKKTNDLRALAPSNPHKTEGLRGRPLIRKDLKSVYLNDIHTEQILPLEGEPGQEKTHTSCARVGHPKTFFDENDVWLKSRVLCGPPRPSYLLLAPAFSRKPFSLSIRTRPRRRAARIAGWQARP